MMGLYTIEALTAVIITVLIDLAITKSGAIKTLNFWITWLIVALFQIPVDGWLTKLSSPIVIYNPHDFSGIRFPFSIPIEDFAYGFALTLLTITIWLRLKPISHRR
ncbi:lycopene cyclase domain-containing protein [Ferrimicrobium sp.]|uniref:lycopene cyclase domain-containing protein n=1 Tax=Ferrimicrobium sp. TaxID=2926050 RepID=UPI00344EE37A